MLLKNSASKLFRAYVAELSALSSSSLESLFWLGYGFFSHVKVLSTSSHWLSAMVPSL